MIEPKSTATIRALAGLAELSADQLEDGASVEQVIATLRRAAEAVRLVIDEDEHDDGGEESETLEQDLTPVELVVSNGDIETPSETSANNKDEQPVLNAG